MWIFLPGTSESVMQLQSAQCCIGWTPPFAACARQKWKLVASIFGATLILVLHGVRSMDLDLKRCSHLLRLTCLRRCETLSATSSQNSGGLEFRSKLECVLPYQD